VLLDDPESSQKGGCGAASFWVSEMGRSISSPTLWADRQASDSTQKMTPTEGCNGKNGVLLGAEKSLRNVAYFGALLKFFLS
jgi:hypothetical protein